MSLRERRRNLLPDMLGGFDRIVTWLIEHIHADFHDYRAAIPHFHHASHIFLEVCGTISRKHEPMIRRSAYGVLEVPLRTSMIMSLVR